MSERDVDRLDVVVAEIKGHQEGRKLGFVIGIIVGILIGSYFSKLLNGRILKKSFGIFVLLMSIVILTKEMFL